MIHGSRKSRILSGISANVYAQIVTIGVQLAGVPLLLHHWGVQYYGEWLLMFSIPSYLGMSDLGLGTVATTEMSLSIARKDYQRAGQVFKGAYFFITSVGLAVCGLFVASVWLLPYHDWLNLQLVQPRELQWAITLLTSYVFLAISLTLLLGAYRTIGRYARGQVISNTFRIMEFAAMLGVVIWGAGIVVAAAAFLIVRVCYFFFVLQDIRSKAVWLKLGKFSWEWPVLRPLLSPSLSMMTVYMGQTFVTQGLVTMVGVVLGASSLVLFSTVRTLCNFAKQLIGIVNLSVFSEYAISIGNQDIGAARRLHTRSVQVNVVLTMVSIVGLKVAGPFVLDLWTKGKVEAVEPFFTLYLVYILVNSMWLGSWNMLLGCNQHQSITRVYLFTSLLVIISAFIGIGRFGISIVPVAMILSDGIFSAFVLKKSLEVLQQPMPEFLRQALSRPTL